MLRGTRETNRVSQGQLQTTSDLKGRWTGAFKIGLLSHAVHYAIQQADSRNSEGFWLLIAGLS
jgi:hypothetical protein